METCNPVQTIKADAQARNTLQRTAEWIEQFGSRLAGSSGCQAAGQAIRGELGRICGAARWEPFQTRPSAFYRFYQVDALIYLAGLILLWLGQPQPAALLLTAMIVCAGLEFGYYFEIYDWLYPKVTCHNVSAVLEPRGAVTRQLIISAHHDAARELKFLQGSQKLYGLKILVPDLTRMLACLTAWAWWGGILLMGSPPPFVFLSRVVLVLGLYPVFTKFFLFTQNVTPGAGDNLVASSMLVELAESLRDPSRIGISTLEHTRLIFASFDAEESGLRGSRAWVKAHRAELSAIPTTALNLDSFYKLADLQFLVSDLNSHVRLDRDLVDRCLAIARRLGYTASPAAMRFGGGGTDAAELAMAGVSATTMIAMSTSIVRDGLVYHTMQDTVDAIEPAAIEASLAITIALARDLEKS